MAARNEEKARTAIEEIEAELRSESDAGSVHWLRLDLSDPRLAKEAATEFTRKEERLDILGMSAKHFYGKYKELIQESY